MQEPNMTTDTSRPATGRVLAVRGAVVDVVYEGTALPPIYSALNVEWDRPTPLILEVHSHLDLTTVRAVAFQSTAGLARGVAVRASSGPVAVPVGDAVLGRLLDVVGQSSRRWVTTAQGHAAPFHSCAAARLEFPNPHNGRF